MNDIFIDIYRYNIYNVYIQLYLHFLRYSIWMYMIVHSDTYLSIFSMYQCAYEVEPSSTSELRPQLGPFWQLSAHMRSPCRMPKGAGWMMYSYHDISWSLSLKYCQVLISHDFNRKSLWATLQNHPTSAFRGPQHWKVFFGSEFDMHI